MINSIVRSRTHKSNPKLEWESIGARIMRTGLARISEDNGETYPKATEAPTPQTLPAAPTAARIYTQTPDGEWVTHCLVFDLDAKKHHSPEDVAHDAHKLTAALAEAGIETITDTSPSGGRHIYVPSLQPIAGHLAQDIVDRLKAHLQLTTCDITPMRGYRSGIIRTPGSPHKHGGHQSLITPLTDAVRILEHGNRNTNFAAYVSTLPVAIKSKRIDPAIYEPNTDTSPAAALSYGWKRYATTGTFRHLKTAKGGRYPSASEARLGFLAYLHRAGYDYPTIRRNTHTWPALADAYSKYSPEERERIMTREWALAATEHGTRRARTQKAPVNPVHYLLRATTPIWATKKANSRKRDRQTAIRQWATLTDVHGTELYGGSEAALSLRLVLKALSAQAYRCGSTVFTCSYRTLRLYTGLSLGTIRNVMTRLLTEENPLLELAYHGGMNRPNSYRLIIPESHAQLATTAYIKGIISPLPQAFYGLDKAAWFIFHSFTRRNKRTLAELIRLTGISARRVARVVKMLVSENFLAETVKGGVKAWCVDQWCDLEELAFWTDGSMAYAQLNAEVTEQQSRWRDKCLRYYRTMKDSIYTKYSTEPNVYRGSSFKLFVSSSRLCADLNSKVQRTRRGDTKGPTNPCSDAPGNQPPPLPPSPPLSPRATPTWTLAPTRPSSSAASVAGPSLASSPSRSRRFGSLR